MPEFTQLPCLYEDFLGLAPEKSPHIWKNITGTGGIGWEKFYGPNHIMYGGPLEQHAINGWLSLWTCAWNVIPAQSHAGLRFGNAGGVAGSSWVDERNWSPPLGLTFEALVYFNQTTDMGVTIGFCGFGDTPNVLEFYYPCHEPGVPTTWQVQINSQFGPPGNGGSFNTDFVHVPFTPVLFRLEIRNTEVKAYINDNLVGSYDGPSTPVMMLVPEMLIGNLNTPAGWARPWMAVDYVGVKQLQRAWI